MPTAEVTPQASVQTHAIQCLEVWGGTEAVDRIVNVPGIDAWVFSRPFEGDATGGDIHYISSCFTGRVARVAVADVAGHGKGVAELSATLRKLMRKNINYLDQTKLARVLNQEFKEKTPSGRFATAVLISYYAPNDHMVICNAGHPRPLWYRAATHTWQLLHHDTDGLSEEAMNLPLGIIEPTNYRQFAVKLSPGDMVVIYTDALMEAADSAGRQLGEDGLLRLAETLHPDAGAQALGRGLVDAVRSYRGGHWPEDDQTVVVLHHNASEFQPQAVREALRGFAALLGLAGD